MKTRPAMMMLFLANDAGRTLGLAVIPVGVYLLLRAGSEAVGDAVSRGIKNIGR